MCCVTAKSARDNCGTPAKNVKKATHKAHSNSQWGLTRRRPSKSSRLSAGGGDVENGAHGSITCGWTDDGRLMDV